MPAPASSTEIGKNLQDVGYLLFNKTTVTIFCAILALYLMFSLGKSIFSPRDGGYEGTSLLFFSRSVDIGTAIVLFVVIYWTYDGLSKNDKSNLLGWSLRWSHEFFNDPNSFLEVILFTVVFFLIVWLFRIPMTPELKPVTVYLMETKIWYFIAMFIIIFFFKYVLQIPIVDLIFNNQLTNYFENLPAVTMNSSKPSSPPPAGKSPTKATGNSATTTSAASTTSGATTSAASTAAATTASTATATTASAAAKANQTAAASCPPSAPAAKKEVFNIANRYTYEEAQAVCKAFGADLATYDQVQDAQLQGGEWCNYGWSDKQLILYPTQKDTWDKLQNSADPKARNMCGMPGMNGGFVVNPYKRFGANCYGTKPEEPSQYQYPELQITPAEAPLQRPSRDDFLRATAKLNAFNNLHKEWSEY